MRLLFIAACSSFGTLVAGFFLAGGHHEIRYRLRQRRRGGYIRRGY